MRVVGARELKNRLSEYLRLVRNGEDVLVTDCGQVIAELRQPALRAELARPALKAVVQGRARRGMGNRPELYPALHAVLPAGVVARLLDLERGER